MITRDIVMIGGIYAGCGAVVALGWIMLFGLAFKEFKAEYRGKIVRDALKEIKFDKESYIKYL